MAEIQPLRGLRYDPDKVGDLGLVVAPPYDIVSPTLQERLYRRHPCNVIRLELNRDGRDPYGAAARHLEEWIARGVLVREAEPVFYAYFLDYAGPDGAPRTLKGLLARLHLEELDKGIVLPHENTLSGPKADRLRLLERCRANFSPIFLLYTDPARGATPVLDAAAGNAPLADITDAEGVRHRLWGVSGAEAAARVQEALAERPVFIADGHHRYETALAYRDLMRERTGLRDGRQPFDYVLVYLADMDEPGLTVFPTHRLVHGLERVDLPALLHGLERCFSIRPYPFVRKEAFLAELAAQGRRSRALGLYTSESDDLFLLVQEEAEPVRTILAQAGVPPVLADLDVTVLQTAVLEPLLGIHDRALRDQSHLRYVKDADDALNAVNDGDAQLAFLLNPTRVEQLRAVSLAGEKMPQKSTYFYPKLLTGLVLNELH